MFVTKKRFDQMMKSGDDLLAQRAENALRDAETISRLQRENARLLGALATEQKRFKLADERDTEALVALTAVAAQATPGANATVKRMARIAKDALDARTAVIDEIIATLEAA